MSRSESDGPNQGCHQRYHSRLTRGARAAGGTTVTAAVGHLSIRAKTKSPAVSRGAFLKSVIV